MAYPIYKLYNLNGDFVTEVNSIPDNFTGIANHMNGSKSWWNKGKIHRLDGPAIEYFDGRKYWHVDDKRVTELQHNLLYDIMKLKGLL